MRVFGLASVVSVAFAAACVGNPATAAPLVMMFERTTDVSSNELAFRHYADNDSMVANTTSQPDAFSPINIASTFDSTGLTWDGTQFITMFERNTDVSSNELAFRFYADIDSMVANTTSRPDAFSAINIASTFNTSGLAWDGTQFIMMFERTTDVSTNELAFRFYADVDSMIANTTSRPDAFSTINVASTFDSRGLTWDGSQFIMMFERNTDVSNNEIAFRYYNNIDSMIANTTSRPDAFSTINVASTFNSSGLTAYGYDTGEHSAIPLPAPVAALGTAIVMLGGLRARARARRQGATCAA